MESDKQCGSCKFFEQGENNSFCGNRKQKNKDYKKYVYYNFGCNLHIEGLAQSRFEYMESRNDFFKKIKDGITK